MTARPGARFGPNGIRQGSRRISSEFAWGVYDGRNYFKEGFKVVDCGDAPLTFLVRPTNTSSRVDVLSRLTRVGQYRGVETVDQDSQGKLTKVILVSCSSCLRQQIISARKANNTDYPVPRIITLGGDHTTTLPALRSTFDHWGAVSVIHFDSHLDTWDPDVLSGGISLYA